MPETKNLIFAIILSTAVLFLWQYFYMKPRIEQAQQQQEVALKVAKERNISDDAQNVPVSRKDALVSGGRIKIKTPSLHGSIALKGARFDDLTLAKYTITQDKDSPDVVLLSPSNTEQSYFAEFGWLSNNNSFDLPDSSTIWNSNNSTLSPEHPVTLTWENAQGVKFYIHVSVDKNYMFTIKREVANYSGKTIRLTPYGIINRVTDTHHKSFAILHEGALGVFGDGLTEVSWHDLEKNKKYEYSNGHGWLGFTDKYWLTALIPDANNSFDAKLTYFKRNGEDKFQADYLGQTGSIESGSSMETTSYFFAGAKEGNLIDKYATSLSIPLFDRAVDFGMLYFITKPLFKLLTFFHKLVGNFGIAIILLTVTVKLIMFPLANKSYVSMHMLKKLQPQVSEIHKRYTDDKIRANKEIMELYKNERVNPMSGCLPMLIQIPVFFALYKVLFVTIEMRHAPFFGWIKDLSEPDPTTIFNLFGLIDWAPPTLLHIGAWPIIMAITMFLQQKMSPAPADPIQAKVMKLLPVIFVFMFASFPAGLVIYWAWNNILSITQQWIITRKLGNNKRVAQITG